MIKKKPFTAQRLEEERAKDKRKVYPVSFNLEEQEFIFSNETKSLLQQTKDSTIIKQLAIIGANLIHSQKIKTILSMVSDNKRKNKRMGLNEFE